MSEKVDYEMRGVIVSLLDIMYRLGIDEDTARIASSKAGLEEVSGAICDVIARAKAVLAESESNCGNNASMREALLMSLEELESHGCIEENYETLGDVPSVRLHKKIRSALSEPARNCDLYHTKEDAQRAFLKDPCEDPCGNCTITDMNNECGVKWLFAKHNKEDK